MDRRRVVIRTSLHGCYGQEEGCYKILPYTGAMDRRRVVIRYFLTRVLWTGGGLL